MSEQWIPDHYWRAAIIPPLRCVQCVRYLPSETAVEDLLEDAAVLCDECFDMRRRSEAR